MRPMDNRVTVPFLCSAYAREALAPMAKFCAADLKKVKAALKLTEGE
jgi:hypothetical protein